jgi:glycine/D-amino acid oxidase-like deaminating enzyme
MGGITDSLWSATAGVGRARAPLAGDLTVDVAIVGAGFTGLWTAYYLCRAAPDLDTDGKTHAGLRRLLAELFPVLAGHEFTHAWGGPLGIARDWHPAVGIDRASGSAWAGGYVGDGVATADREESRSGRPAQRARAIAHLLGY